MVILTIVTLCSIKGLMSRFLKRVFISFDHLAEGCAEIAVFHVKRSKKSRRPSAPIELPADIKAAIAKDMTKIGSDMYSAIRRTDGQ
jgi:hypothetical protein